MQETQDSGSQQERTGLIEARQAVHDVASDSSRISPSGRYLSACMGHPFRSDNSVELLRNGDQIFPAICAAIDEAEQHIEFQTYVYWKGEIAITVAEHLAAAARRGVRVRVLIDSFGGAPIEEEALRLIEEHCDLVWFRPLKKLAIWRNLKRSHRKLIICDGKVGFTGGVGFGEKWTGNGDAKDHWRDNHYRLRGPIISALQAGFLHNWLEACPTDQEINDTLAKLENKPAGKELIMPLASTASDFWSTAGTLIFTAVAASRHTLRITTPYFVTDSKLLSWLISASKRGVEVEVIIPAFDKSDSRLASLAALRCVQPLLREGIRIFTFNPTFIHNKCVIVDDEVAIVGSVNFNQRSQRKDDEFSLVIDQGETVEALVEDFCRDRENSELLEFERFKKRYRYLGLLAQLVQPFRRHF